MYHDVSTSLVVRSSEAVRNKAYIARSPRGCQMFWESRGVSILGIDVSKFAAAGFDRVIIKDGWIAANFQDSVGV